MLPARASCTLEAATAPVPHDFLRTLFDMTLPSRENARPFSAARNSARFFPTVVAGFTTRENKARPVGEGLRKGKAFPSNAFCCNRSKLLAFSKSSSAPRSEKRKPFTPTKSSRSGWSTSAVPTNLPLRRGCPTVGDTALPPTIGRWAVGGPCCRPRPLPLRTGKLCVLRKFGDQDRW